MPPEIHLRNTMTSSFTVILLYLFLAFIFRQGNCCPKDWIQDGNECYGFFRSSLAQRVAEIECQTHDSSLMAIPTYEKFQFVADTLYKTYKTSFWVGFHINRYGEQFWNDYYNSPADNYSYIDYSNFKDGSRCFVFDTDKITAQPCQRATPFICQRSNIESECPIETTGTFLSDLCFWIERNKTWIDAAQTCSEHGANAAGFRELLRGGFAIIKENRYGSGFWVRDSFLQPEASICRLLTFGLLWMPYKNNEPCEESHDIICFGSAKNINFEYETTTPTSVDDVTTEEITYAAQNLLAECPHGYNWKEDTLSGFCYWETSYETNQLTWQEARDYCKVYGGDLASFHSEQEEKIGLSFQYGSLEHPYWIGLIYNHSTHDYTWADGSEVSYTNWGPGEPRNYRFHSKCVQMESHMKHWIVSYCGQLSWFVCRAPKKFNPGIPQPPTAAALQTCSPGSTDFYWNGNCYTFVGEIRDWRRAQDHCREKNNGNLVSIHSENELSFLIQMLHYSKGIVLNTVWIGVKLVPESWLLHMKYTWSDGSAVDFVNWDVGQPAFSESCVYMHHSLARWTVDSCSEKRGSICKWSNDSSVTPTASPAPLVGNCEEGWYRAFGEMCYALFGAKNAGQRNWFNASARCIEKGATLAIIHNAEEQALLTFLIQDIKSSAWIGLHDTIEDSYFQWLDHSPLMFSNWAPGEPSMFEHNFLHSNYSTSEEDCVSMSYKGEVSGLWYDTICELELPFICQKRKDPKITKASFPRSNRCVLAEGWLKQGMACYKFFTSAESYQKASEICAAHHSRLISITDTSVEAVANFLTIKSNETFWIGLVSRDNYSVSWTNGFPMTLSRWNSNEPQFKRSKICFGSNVTDGWMSYECDEKKPFICQITSGRPAKPQPVSGSCPTEEWIDIGTGDCYRFGTVPAFDMSNAILECSSNGGKLASIHSLEEMDLLRKYSIPSTGALIGLVRNGKKGFSWMDGSPVDFVYWDKGEAFNPLNECVQLVPGSFKWQVSSCQQKNRGFLCKAKKTESASGFDRTSSNLNAGTETGLSSGGVAAIVIVIVILVTGALAWILYPRYAHHLQPQLFNLRRNVGFENTLYKAGDEDIQTQRTDAKYECLQEDNEEL